MEAYQKPEMDIIDLSGESVILTSAGCLIVEMRVTYEDEGGNEFSTSVPGF